MRRSVDEGGNTLWQKRQRSLSTPYKGILDGRGFERDQDTGWEDIAVE